MTRDTSPPDIYALFSRCITYLDTIIRETTHQSSDFKKDFPPEVDIQDIRQDFNNWGIRYGANRSISSTLSLDYKFRKQDYTRSTIESQLGHLVEDLEGRKLSCRVIVTALTGCAVQKLCRGDTYQGEANVVFLRVENVVNELIRFLGHLPKDLWLQPDR